MCYQTSYFLYLTKQCLPMGKIKTTVTYPEFVEENNHANINTLFNRASLTLLPKNMLTYIMANSVY